MKIANKISISFLTVVLILISITGFIFYKVVKKDLKNRISSQLIITAQSDAAHIETFLESQGETVKQMSKSIVLEEFLLAKKGDKNYRHWLDDANKRLERTVKKAKYMYDVFLLNKKGIIVASSDRVDIGKDKSNDAYFLGGKKGFFIKDAYCPSDKKLSTIAFCMPIMDKEKNNFIGIVVMRVSMEPINEITTSRFGLGKKGEIYLVNKDGFMITPSRFRVDTFLKLKIDSEGVKKGMECLEKKERLREKERKTFIYKNYRGVSVLGAHDHLSQLSWILVVEMDEKEALAPLAKLKALFVGMAFIVSTITWIGGFLLARNITLPIKKLEKGVERIGKGDLDCWVATQAKDEIGQLSRAFNKMAQDLKGSTASIDILNQEVIQRKEAEQRLLLFSHSVESAIEGIAMGNLSGEINYINESLIEMFGYSKEEIIGKKISFLYDEVQLSRLQEALKETMKGGWKGELVGKKKDGTFFPVELHSSIVKDTTGRVIAHMATHTDISERKQAEERIKMFSHSTESAIEGIAIANLEGRFTYVNKAFVEMFGYSKETLLGKEIAFIYCQNEDQQSRLQAAVEGTREGKWKGELLARRKNGGCFPIEVNSSIVKDNSGKTIALVASHTDITQRKQAEEKMKESIKAKSDFLSMVSHELRTPLTAIKEGIGIVLDRSAGEINTDQEDFLATAKRNVDRLHRLINQVLDFSKLEARKAEFRMEERDINQIIKEIVKMQQPVAKDKGLYVKLDLGDNLDKILFDVDKISQVLTNLTNNALKHTDKGGITVSSKKDKDGEFIRVGIKDTGEGIREEELSKLFQQFQQVGKKFRKSGSTGLGLAISKQIVSGHKGKIWAESQHRVGSEFIFTLPVVKDRRDKDG